MRYLIYVIVISLALQLSIVWSYKPNQLCFTAPIAGEYIVLRRTVFETNLHAYVGNLQQAQVYCFTPATGFDSIGAEYAAQTYRVKGNTTQILISPYRKFYQLYLPRINK